MPGLINLDTKAITDLIGKGIDRIWPDKSAEQQAALEREFELLQAQLEINKAEAANPNWFVAGWRPAVGWVCVAALSFQYVALPIVTLWGVKVPAFDFSALITLLLTMLGMGTLRTIEKSNSSEGNR